MMLMLRLQDEYRDYLLRYAENAPAWAEPPLTFEAFCAAVERWTREYNRAWRDNCVEQMVRLENSLQLLAQRAPLSTRRHLQ